MMTVIMVYIPGYNSKDRIKYFINDELAIRYKKHLQKEHGLNDVRIETVNAIETKSELGLEARYE